MLSPASAVAVNSKVAPALTAPLKTMPPFAFATRMGSPVNAASSSVADFGRYDAVDWNDFAGPREKPVSDNDRINRHVVDPISHTAMGYARRTIDKGAQTALGPGNRDLLKHIAAGIH